MAEQRLTGEERSTLYWELSRLCRAGLDWRESVALVGREAATPALRGPLRQLEQSLESGLSLTAAVEATGRFPVWQTRLLEIGEVSGRLDQVLEALSGYDKREAASAAAFREASVYPLVMVAFIGVIFLFLGWKVMPIFQGVFHQMGMSGPGAAGRIVVMVLGGVFLLGAAVLLLLLRLGGGRAPVARGKTAVATARSRFASAMALMLRSGLPLEESLERTAALLSDSPLAGAVERCRAAVAGGADLAQAVGGAGLLDPFQVSLIAAGGRAGSLPEAMEEAERRSGEEARACRERTASRFEFALVAFLCAAVAGVLLSVMLPLLQVLSALGG